MGCDLFREKQVTNQVEAYLLGFIYADGTILFSSANKARYSTMKIDLAVKDEDFLLRLNEYLRGHVSYHSVYLNGKEFKQVRTSVYDVNFVNRLMDLGISHNKTYEERDYVFTNVPEHLKWHFIRGFFDGDGSITFNSRGQGEFCVGCHNKTLMMSIHAYISRHISTNSNVVAGDGVWRIRYFGNRLLERLCNLLYEDAVLKLDRKYLLIRDVTGQSKKSSKYRHVRFQPHCYFPYSVWFMIDGRQKTLGRFRTEHEALEFYTKECEFHGLKPQYELRDEQEITYG